MGVLKGDFISFSFNGVHSSDLGIIRTSDGTRFNKNLFPTIQDKTTQVPGADGTYFFNTYYVQRQFTIPVAFDSLTEQQLFDIQKLFGTKDLCPLIFDEEPYKYYMVKSTGAPQFRTICFEEEYEEQNGDTVVVKIKRIYKGEGNINLVAYFPYARSRKMPDGTALKYLNQYTPNTIPEWEGWANSTFSEVDSIQEDGSTIKIPFLGHNHLMEGENSADVPANFPVETIHSIGNRNEWAAASGMLESTSGEYNGVAYDIDKNLAYETYLYNAGAIETDFELYFAFNENWEVSLSELQLRIETPDTPTEKTSGIMRFNTIKRADLDTESEYVKISSKTNLIEGYKKNVLGEWEATGYLYNQYLIAGDFFKIPTGFSFLIEGNHTSWIELRYDYLYY